MDTNETQQISDKPAMPVGSDADSATDRSDASLLRLYVGKNADIFEKIRAAIETRKVLKAEKAPFKVRRQNNRKISKINWCALFLGPVWFFYRKLYIEATAIILFPVLLIYLMPALANVQFGFGIILGLLTNQYYVWRAQKRIATIEQMPIPGEARDELIQKRGGVSIAGLILGLGIYIALIGLLVVSVSQTLQALPTCNDSSVRKLVEELAQNHLRSRNIPTAGMTMGAISETSAAAETRNCALTLQVSGKNPQYMVKLTWQDKAKNQFKAELFTAN